MNKGSISKSRFLNYLKVQKSGRINMFGYDISIQKNYENCYKWFIDEKKEGDFIYEIR